MQNQSAEVIWTTGPNGDIPVSVRFDDPYCSLKDGLAETHHVFMAGNDLPARFCDGFHIAELGFGTGLNALVAWDAWSAAGFKAPLHFTSFEAYPMTPEDMARAHAVFPEFDGKRDALLAAWDGSGGAISLPGLELDVVIGDARVCLPAWHGKADAWFLDGFSPAKNPELWSPELMADVARHTLPYGTASTYTAAGFVRRGLRDAGFDVSREKGYGRKLHMNCAKMPG